MDIIDRDGKGRPAMPGEVLGDGETLRVRLTLMDAAPESGDAAGREAWARGREEYKKRLSNVWRGPQQRPAASEGDPHERYVNRITNAWRRA